MNARIFPLLLPVLAFVSCAGPEAAFNPTSEGTRVADTAPGALGGTSGAQELAGDREGIMRRGGQLYYVKNRGVTLLTGAQRITPDLYFERNGDVSLKDGRRFPVREGTMVTASGEVIPTPPYLQ